MKRKTYTITEITEDDGRKHIERRCDGFNALELLGILSWTQTEILYQIKGKYQPDTVTREIVLDKVSMVSQVYKAWQQGNEYGAINITQNNPYTPGSWPYKYWQKGFEALPFDIEPNYHPDKD